MSDLVATNPGSSLMPAHYTDSKGLEITYRSCFLLFFFNAELSVANEVTAGAWERLRMEFY